MTFEDLKELVYRQAKNCGAKESENCQFRSVGQQDKEPHVAIVRAEEPASNIFRDFCLAVFPDNVADPRDCVVCICVGLGNFNNDYQLATMPWWRREVLKFSRSQDVIGKNRHVRIKTAFDDVESPIPELFDKFSQSSTAAKYKNAVVCGERIDVGTTTGRDYLAQWVSLYARLRQWPSNAAHRKAVENATVAPQAPLDQVKEISALLQNHKYIVLQGAPGTGKTFHASKIANSPRFQGRVIFTQFHAETTYSDFVSGLRPNASGGFQQVKGALLRAIEMAENNRGRDTLLIIDEINRANLANVLGPVFYLFERNSSGPRPSIEIDGQKVVLPENLYVIATMNTADRSLAVVDFALRRRFMWYTLRPECLSDQTVSPQRFFSKDFIAIDNIFTKYATDTELSLQPGQSYFIATDEKQYAERVKYELMPLIKEYLTEGYLSDARHELEALFTEKGLTLFE